jgi:hypothetical protein
VLPDILVVLSCVVVVEAADVDQVGAAAGAGNTLALHTGRVTHTARGTERGFVQVASECG